MKTVTLFDTPIKWISILAISSFLSSNVYSAPSEEKSTQNKEDIHLSLSSSGLDSSDEPLRYSPTSNTHSFLSSIDGYDWLKDTFDLLDLNNTDKEMKGTEDTKTVLHNTE